MQMSVHAKDRIAEREIAVEEVEYIIEKEGCIWTSTEDPLIRYVRNGNLFAIVHGTHQSNYLVLTAYRLGEE